MGRRRQHQAGCWPMPVSEWALEVEKRGGGAAATAAGVMNAVQLRKEGRKEGGLAARQPAPRPVGSLDCLSSSLEFDELRTKHRRGDGEREIEGDLEVRFAARFSTPSKNMA